MGVGRADGEVLAEAAVHMGRQHLQLAADVVAANAAGIAVAAGGQGIDDHVVAQGQALHPFAQGANLAGQLMAQDARVAGEGRAAVQHVHVRAADAGRPQPNLDLSRTRHGVQRNLLDDKLARRFHHHGLHVCSFFHATNPLLRWS